MPTLFILLTKSKTLLSRVISLATGAQYTHVSIGLTYTDEFYSFARRYPYFPLPAGFVHEELSGGYWKSHPHTPCCLLSLPVDHDAYDQICGRLHDMGLHAQDYRYNLRGILRCAFAVPSRQNHSYFCSQFIGELLAESGVCRALDEPSLLHPDDFLALPNADHCYYGTVGDLALRIQAACCRPHLR